METETKQSRTFVLIGGKLCLDFVNTVGNWGSVEKRSEHLKGYEDLVSWSEQVGIFSKIEAQNLLAEAKRKPEKAVAVLSRAIVLREAVYQIFAATANGKKPQEEDLQILNRELLNAVSRSQIVHTKNGFAWEWIEKENSLEAMLWRVVRSAVELLISDAEISRVKECSDRVCRWLFLDASKNRSRRWCEMRDCGSKAKSRRFYERTKARRSA